MRKILSYFIICVFIFNISFTYSDFNIETKLPQTKQSSYKKQIDNVYKSFENKIYKLNENDKKDTKNKIILKINKLLKKKLSDKNNFVLEYLKYLLSSNNIVKNVVENNITTKPIIIENNKNIVQNIPTIEIKNRIKNIKSKYYDIKFINDKTIVENNCFLTKFSFSTSNINEKIKEIETEISNSFIERDYKYQKPSFYIYIDENDINKSIFYYDKPISTITGNIIKENGKYVLKYGDCKIDKITYEKNKNLKESYYLLNYINSGNIDELVYKILTSGLRLNYSQQLLDLGIVKNENIVNGLNLLRKEYNLSKLNYSETLSLASKKHEEYLNINAGSLYAGPDDSSPFHYENEKLNGFYGESPDLRVKKASGNNFYGNVTEGVGNGINILNSINSLLYVPYHRMQFLDKTINEIGFYKRVVNAGKNEKVTIDYNTYDDSDEAKIYPYNEAELLIYDDIISERPRPFPNNEGIKGFVFTIQRKNNDEITKNTVKLKNVISGKEVPIIFDKENKICYKRGTLHFINSNPLEKNGVYEISFSTILDNTVTKSYFYTGLKEDVLRMDVVEKYRNDNKTTSTNLSNEYQSEILNPADSTNRNDVNTTNNNKITGTIEIESNNNEKYFLFHTQDKSIELNIISESDKNFVISKAKLDGSDGDIYYYLAKDISFILENLKPIEGGVQSDIPIYQADLKIVE